MRRTKTEVTIECDACERSMGASPGTLSIHIGSADICATCTKALLALPANLAAIVLRVDVSPALHDIRVRLQVTP